MSATMSLGRYNTAGSCGPPCPEVRLSRSCPTTSSVPPGDGFGGGEHDGAALLPVQVQVHHENQIVGTRRRDPRLDVGLQGHQSSGVAAELLLGERGSPLQCRHGEVHCGGMPSAGGKPKGVAALSGRNIKGRAGWQIAGELLDPDVRCGGPDEVAAGITLVPCGLIGAVHVVSLRWI